MELILILTGLCGATEMFLVVVFSVCVAIDCFIHSRVIDDIEEVAYKIITVITPILIISLVVLFLGGRLF